MRSLTPERWQQLDALFEAALECPAEEREAYVRSRCAEDPELLREVLLLLESVDDAEAALGESVSRYAEPVLEDLRAALDREELTTLPGGGRIGPYRLREVLGRGGMGTVYLAERADDQFQQKVALKLVKRGMDTDEVLQRFRYERQILAALQHPNIGRLYDGGAAEDGRPYLVMEYLEGEPVTTYCDARSLTIDQRLRIFETICEAVQYAHRNLVIHRDLKPSNILVTAEGSVKLLDFGIAKLLDPAQAESLPRTRTEMRLLTPEYASPEQMAGTPVSTASDVYSLGVILFELLTGRRPRDPGGRGEGERFGLDTSTGRPSSTVRRPYRPAGGRDRTISPDEIADRRSSTPERLRSRLRGDLDTITMKALAEEPERRYQSAEQLLADVQRYRRGLPVFARGESLGYRAAKFVRRHQLVVSLSAVVALLVIGFAGTTFLQNRLLREARATAEARQGQAEDLIGFIFDDLRPKLVAIGQSDWLMDAATRAEAYFTAVPPEELSDQELYRRTEQMRLLGQVRLDRGDGEGALESFRAAHALSTSLLQRDPGNATWRLGLATDHFWLGSFSYQRGQLPEALEHFHAYRDHTRRLVSEHPDEPEFRLELSYALGNVGTVLQQMGDWDGALDAFLTTLEQKEALARQDRGNTEYQSALATAYNKVAVAEQRRGDLTAALRHFQAELEVRRALVDLQSRDRPERRLLSLSHSFLGELLGGMGEVERALEHHMEALRLQRELVAWDPANVAWQRGLATSTRLAGSALVAAGRTGEGLATLRESREILEDLLQGDPQRPEYLLEMARVEWDLAEAILREEPAGAEAAARRALGILTEAPGDLAETPAARRVESGAHLVLGAARSALGGVEAAEDSWNHALALVRDADGSDGLEHLATRAAALLYLGRTGEARPLIHLLFERDYRHPRLATLVREKGLPTP